FLVHDSELDHVGFDSIASPKTGAVPFSVTGRAFNIDGETIATYNGPGSLSATGQAGTLPITPTSATFRSGVWAGNVAINAIDPVVLLTLNTGGIVGDSNTFGVVPGPVTHFVWSAIATPQIAQVAFNATITAKDAHEFVATGFNGTTTLGS